MDTITKTTPLLDRIMVDILITEADILNLNNRSYTKESLQKAVTDAQLYARLGLLTVYEEHPNPVFDQAGEVAGYDNYERVPVGRFTKIWMVDNRVYGTAYLFNTEAGKKYEQRIRNKEKINVSLRALGGCKLLANGKKICNVDRIEGCDIVKNPALPSASVINYREVVQPAELITDSVCTATQCNCDNKCKSYITNIYQSPELTGERKMNIAETIRALLKEGQLGDITDSMSELVTLLQRSGANEQVLNNFQAYLLGQESVQLSPVGMGTGPTPPTEQELLLAPPPTETATPDMMTEPVQSAGGPNPAVPAAPMAGRPVGAGAPAVPAPVAPAPGGGSLEQQLQQLIAMFSQFLKLEMAEKAAESRKEMMPPAGEGEGENPAAEGEKPPMPPENKGATPEAPSENSPPENKEPPGDFPPKKEDSGGFPPKKEPAQDMMKEESPPEKEEQLTPEGESTLQAEPVEAIEEKKARQCSLQTNTNTEPENITDDKKEKRIMEINDALLAKLVAALEGMSAQQSAPSVPAPTVLSDDLAELVQENKVRKVKDQIRARLNSVVATGKVKNVDLSIISSEKVSALVDKVVNTAQSPDEAENQLEFAASTLADMLLIEKQNTLKKQLGNGPKGRSVAIEFISDADDNAWKPYNDKLEKAINDNRKRFFPGQIEEINAHAEVNKDFVNDLLDEHDRVNAELYRQWTAEQKTAVRDGAITDAALVIGNSDMRNMPIISRNIIKQLFQRLVALQYVQALGPSKAIGSPGPGGGPFGSEFKIPSVVYVPPTHNKKGYVGPTEAIPQASTAIRFQSFWAQLRAIGFAVSDQLVDQLKNGALQIDPVALMVDQVTQDMARRIDTHLLEEFQQTCDEYGAVAVTSEVSVGGNAVYSAGGSAAITYDGATVTYGSGVTFVVKALSGASGGRPIVLPRTIYTLDATGTEGSTVRNAISVTFAATTQVRGELDSNRQIVAINPGETPTYAVDFERGYFVFNAASGADGTLMPTLNYSYATNYVTFDLDLPSGVLAEDHYNGLLNLSLQTAANLDAAPRYQKADTLLFPSTVGIGAVGISGLFHKRKQPDWVALNAGFATTDALGKVGPLNLTTTNGEMFAGDRRAILFKRYMTGYGVQIPAALDGPYPNVYAPSGGGIVQLTPGQQWALKTRDAVGTPLPLNSSGAIMQHPGITIRFLGAVAS